VNAKGAFLWLVMVYSGLGTVVFFVWLIWDTAERTKKRIYWYPGPGLTGCLIMLIWPLVVVGLSRLYRDRKS